VPSLQFLEGENVLPVLLHADDGPALLLAAAGDYVKLRAPRLQKDGVY